MKTRRTYVVTAASGRTGTRIARGLLAAGHRVHVIGRSPARLAPLAEAGAEPWVGDVLNAAFLSGAFVGADAVYLVVTADRQARDFRGAFKAIGRNFAAAAAAGAAGVGRALFLSTMCAWNDRYRGFHLLHGDVEQILNEVADLDILHLRAPAFAEILQYFLPASIAAHALAAPIDADAELDLVETADVAATALDRLLALNFGRGEVVELQAAAPVTLRRLASIIEDELGHAFGIRRVGRDDDIDALIAGGLGRDFATLLNDTWDAFSRYGLLRAPGGARVEIASRTPEAFVRERIVPSLRTALVPA